MALQPPKMVINENEKVTPHRNTHVDFDLNTGFIVEPPISMGRKASDMFAGEGGSHNNLQYMAGGWGVRGYATDVSILYERDEATSTVLTQAGGTLTVAPGIIEHPIWRPPTDAEMLHATAGASTHLATQGVAFQRKSIAAGTDYTTVNLAADQAAFPGPIYSDINPYALDFLMSMDRIAVSRDNDSSELNIHLNLTFCGTALSMGTPATFYFNGPAGSGPNTYSGSGTDNRGDGLGQYCMVFTFGGEAILLERIQRSSNGSLFWLKRMIIKNWSQGQFNENFILRIHKSLECKGPTDGPGGWITFDFAAAPQAHMFNEVSLSKALLDLSFETIARSEIHRHKYRVPGDGTLPTHNASLRLDIRRDVNCLFIMGWERYPTDEITADDEPFQLPVFPTNSVSSDAFPFQLSWQRCVPDGCSLELKLMAMTTADVGFTFAELAIQDSGDNWKIYTCNPTINTYFVRMVIKSNGLHTPILHNWLLVRDCEIKNTGIPLFSVGDATHQKSVVTSVECRGAERDLSHESATIVIKDPLNKMTELQTRSGMPIRIHSEYNTDPAKPTFSIFRGFVAQATQLRRRSGAPLHPVHGIQYPDKKWSEFSVQCNGIWQQVDQNFIDTPMFTTFDRDGKQRMAPELVRSVISTTGFDFTDEFQADEWEAVENQVPILAGSSLDFSQGIDMLAKVSEVSQSLIRDYLNAFLEYDDDIQKWRLITPPISPYANLAEFVTDVPTTPAAPMFIAGINSYPSTGGTVHTSGYVPPKYLINSQHPINTYVKKPEANWLQVTSVGAWNSQGGTLFTTPPLWNPKSFDYMGVATSDTNDPDYLGYRLPIYVIDPALIPFSDDTPNALYILARRLADLTFHATTIKTFTAPLITVQHEKDVTKVRKLRYYDPILIDGEQWLIRNVNPIITKDSFQQAVYECEKPRF